MTQVLVAVVIGGLIVWAIKDLETRQQAKNDASLYTPPALTSVTFPQLWAVGPTQLPSPNQVGDLWAAQ